MDPETVDTVEVIECPMCSGPAFFLGSACGTFVHMRCRNCGMTFLHDADPELLWEDWS